MNENPKTNPTPYQPMNETTGEKKKQNLIKNWKNSLRTYPATDNCKQLLSCERVTQWNVCLSRTL